jgi:hypothetical protein
MAMIARARIRLASNAELNGDGPIVTDEEDECLNINVFWSLAHARIVIGDWKRDNPG